MRITGSEFCLNLEVAADDNGCACFFAVIMLRRSLLYFLVVATKVSLRFPYSRTILIPYCPFPYRIYDAEPFLFHTEEGAV